MDVKQAGLSLDSLVSSFNTRIAELQDLVVARNSKSTSTTKGSPMGVTVCVKPKNSFQSTTKIVCMLSYVFRNWI